MSSPTNTTELNPQATEETLEKACRRKSSTSTISFSRLFSRDSIISNLPRYSYELYPASNYEYSLCGKEFLLKIAEIVSKFLLPELQLIDYYFFFINNTVNISYLRWYVC